MQKPNLNEFMPNCYNNNGDKMVNAILPTPRRTLNSSLQSQGINLSAVSASLPYENGVDTGIRTGRLSNHAYGSNLFYQNAVFSTTDVGICMGMSNCHLTENSNDEFNSLISSDYSILQQYHPQALSHIVPSPANGYQNNYILNKEQIQEVCYLSRFNYVANSHLDKLMSLDRPSDSSYQRSSCNEFLTNIFKSNNYEMNYGEDSIPCSSQNHHRITAPIKFQDKNRKLDFKANFLEENKKINGCFHDNVNANGYSTSPRLNGHHQSLDSPPREAETSHFSSNIAVDEASSAPPKKKWIRHYMKEEVAPQISLNNNSDGAPSLVVISRPSVQYSPPNQQHQSIDLSKNSPIHVATLTSSAISTPTTHIVKTLPVTNGKITGSTTVTTTSSNPIISSNNIPNNININGSNNSITIFNHIDESNTSLNLTSDTSGYLSNSTDTSLINASFSHKINVAPTDNTLDKGPQSIQPHTEQQLQQEVQRIQQQAAFNPLPLPNSTMTGSRRRTISSNSNSGALRSPSTVRAGTREVHNKLEKNRRAHLKECFEALKKQLPITADEKKTSNLSILGAAIRHIQLLKRKEREYEHEMERLAKEKIASQNRILFLKRELAQWDIDYSKLIPEQPDISSMKVERDQPNDQMSNKNGVKYSSSSSLSSIATAGSSCANIPPSSMSTNVSPTMPISPSRSNMMSSPMPLTAKTPIEEMTPVKFTTTNQIKVSPVNPSSSKSLSPIISSQQMTALNLKSESGTTATIPLANSQTMPLNLHAPAAVGNTTVTNIYTKSLYQTNNNMKGQPMNGMKNGLIKSVDPMNDYSKLDKDKMIKSSGVATITQISPAPITTMSGMKAEPIEPPTKMIKLHNGTVAPVDNNKMVQLALSQVVGGAGLVVQPIQLRVIGQPSSMTTIELTSPPPMVNGQTLQHRPNITQQISTPVTGAQLHKLLVNGTPTTSGPNINTLNIPVTQHAQQSGTRISQPELTRLSGGADINVLPSSTSNGLYRSQGGKLAIVNNSLTIKEANNSRAVHVMTPLQSSGGLTPIVVSQGPQNSTNLAHIIAAPTQLTGKVMTTPLSVGGQLPILTATAGTQYLSSVKPMVVVTNHNNVSMGNTHDTLASTSSIIISNNKHLATTAASSTKTTN